MSHRTALAFVWSLALPGVLTAADPPDWAGHPVNEWIRQSPREGKPVPTVGWEGSGAYDPIHDRWIHQGGHDGIPQGFALFTYDLGSGQWEQKFPPTSPPGSCCVDGANTFDVVNRRFVRFPGASLGHGYQWSRGVKFKSSAVWLYDPAAGTWTDMRPPPYRKPLNARDWLGSLNAGAAYDGKRGVALSFGGQGNAGGTNNLFAYDAHANRLECLDAEDRPSPRDGMGLAYDTKNDCLVMFGSQYGDDEKTWIYRHETGKWEGHDLDPHPPGKKLGTYSTIPRLAYDSANGVCLCLTWDTNTGEHQTWALDVAKLRWTKLDPPAEPTPSMSRSRNLDYSAKHNVFILELAPQKDRGKGVEIWTYRYRAARPAEGPAAPADLKVVAGEGKATLTWSASPGAKGYRIYRAEGERPWELKFAKVGEADGPTFGEGLDRGKVYHYRVTAVGADGKESTASQPARTQPRVLPAPVVSVVGRDRVEVTWDRHPDADVAGYNLYRGLVTVRTVTKGVPKPWRDNDPEYAEPRPVEVTDITRIRKVNAEPLGGTAFTDAVELRKAGPESRGYRYAVHAYIVRAVNRLGTESGPSPYALTIPSAPRKVMLRERGKTAELRWDANPEKGVAGYHVYRLEGTWNVVRVTREPVTETEFREEAGGGTTRYWVVAVDGLGQEGEPSSPVWYNKSYKGFFKGEWHQ